MVSLEQFYVFLKSFLPCLSRLSEAWGARRACYRLMIVLLRVFEQGPKVEKPHMLDSTMRIKSDSPEHTEKHSTY